MNNFIILPDGSVSFLLASLTFFGYEGEFIDDLNDFDFTNTTFTRVELENKINEYSAEYIATEYQRLRKAEYDKLDQDELIFDDELNGTQIWIDTINAIKAQYPQP